MNRDPDSYQWCWGPDSLWGHAALERYDCAPGQKRTVRGLCGARFAGYEEFDNEDASDDRCVNCLRIIRGE